MPPDRWGLARVGDLIEAGELAVSDGYRVRNSELGLEGIPFVRGGDIGNGSIMTATTDRIRPEFASRVQSKLAQPGDVAFIVKGTVGRAGRLRTGQPKVVFAPQVSWWRVLDHDTLDPAFVYYVVRSRDFQTQLDGVKTHGAMVADYVSLVQQGDFRIPVPPIGEQRAIGALLGVLDDKIELNRRMSEMLEELAQAIFRSWFIDFDPVRAKAEGRAPVGMAAETAALFPDSFEDIDGRSVPAGWEVKAIGDVVQVLGGSTPGTAEPAYWGGGTAFATPRDLSGLGSRVLLRTERTVTPDGLSRISSGELPVGTVLLSSRAPIGYLAITEIPVAVNQGFIAMRCDGVLSNLFILEWTEAHLDQVKSRANGSTFPEISKANFRPIAVTVPPPPVERAFDAVARPLYQRNVAALRESVTLAELRDILLPKLISGEIRIRDAERKVEAAT